MIKNLLLYTKDNCIYCHFLKEKLDDWEFKYDVVHNVGLPADHKTYPQLYYEGIDVQRGSSTDLTRDDLMNRIERIEWPNMDSGVEGKL